VDGLVIEPGRAPFVGRARELQLLDDLAARAAAGEPQLAFIEGEAGLGKSRLLAEVVRRRTADGWVTLRGDADELPTAPPYGPFVAALRSWSDVNGVEAVRALAGDWTPHLATLLPELRDRGRHRAAGASTAADPAAVAEAWAQVLRSLAANGPLLVALDDLQWADEASRDLLRYLRRRLRGSPLLLACADRGEAGQDGDRRPHVGGEMARARQATLLLLGRLDRPASRDLVSGLLGAPAGARLTDVVQREGEGDPFIVEELVRGLVDQGRIVRDGAAWELVGDEPAGLPAGMRDALEARLAGLEPGQRAILAAAAVVGRRFTADQVTEVAGREPAEVEAALGVARRRRFVEADGLGWFDFAHDKIREALYGDLGAADRRLAHERVLDALAALPAPVDPMRLAYHALRGEHPHRAVAPLFAAAANAADAGAAADAAEQYRAAVAVLRLAGSPSELEDALQRLGSALTEAGRYDAAVETLDEALRLARDRRDLAAAAGCLERLAAVHLAREHPDPAESALRAALDALGEDAASASRPGEPADSPSPPGEAARTRVLLLLARLFITVTGRLDDGARIAEEARDLAASTGDTRRQAEALALLGQAAMHAGDFDAGRRHFDTAVGLVDPVRDPGLAADMADGLARLSFWTASFHRATAAAESGLDAARRTGDPHRLGWPTFWLAQSALGLGDWAVARSRATELIDLGSRLGARRLLGQGHHLLGIVEYWTGAYPAACAEIEAGLGHLRLIGPGTLVYYLGPYGLALLAAGRTAEAETVLAELLALAGTFAPHSSPRVQAHNVAARLALGLGRRDPAERDELRGADRQFHWYPVASTLALLSLPDDPVAAARHAAVARLVIEEGGGSIHLAEVLAIEASLADRRGDRSGAASLRGRAEATVRARGAAPVAAGLAPAAAPSRAASVPPGGALSARELEVLGLVAAGLTNREIAEALSIAEKTAINHVTHIFDKLGVSNRAAAASWAIRNERP
jgi:DNA-binding CsgD family transcriptional regulator/tetratricopeptide (TPR) repeat protein